eukprot:TRINITY_DN13250_c0_g1_i1.p1 TRINITY_DN13250_c0_g1~~TRINITY_DN13250_c0_g1_i1.p1  ORF type:complete len:203 (-),score=39.09 TRINITY_DN13250_c0_g1_i1:47-655(-)
MARWSRTFEANITHTERIRKERRRLGLDKPGKLKTTADVMAANDWQPTDRGGGFNLEKSVGRPRPRVGSTAFAYGSFHIDHPEVEAAARRREAETSAAAQQELERRRMRNMQIRHPMRWQRLREQQWQEESQDMRQREPADQLARSESEPSSLSLAALGDTAATRSLRGTVQGLAFHEGDLARTGVEERLSFLERTFTKQVH